MKSILRKSTAQKDAHVGGPTEEARLPPDVVNASKKEEEREQGAKSQDKSTPKKNEKAAKTVIEVIHRRHDASSVKDTKNSSVVISSSRLKTIVDVADGGSEKPKSKVRAPEQKSEVITGDWKCSSCSERQSALLRVCLKCCMVRTSANAAAAAVSARDLSASPADEHSAIVRDGWGGVNEHFLILKETRTTERVVSPDKDSNFNLKGVWGSQDM